MTIEQIEQLLKLKKEYPIKEIIFMVDTEVVCDDNFSYWKAKLKKIEISNYIEYNEIIYTNLLDFRDILSDDIWNDELSDEENEKFIDKKMEEINIEKKIIVWLGV